MIAAWVQRLEEQRAARLAAQTDWLRQRHHCWEPAMPLTTRTIETQEEVDDHARRMGTTVIVGARTVTEPTIHQRIAELQAKVDSTEGDGYGSTYQRLDELVADRNEHVYNVANELVDVLYAFMGESSTHLTCTEFEAVLALYEAVGRDVSDLRTGSSHVHGDEPGDEHYEGPDEDDDEDEDDGKVLIAGVLYDTETLEEADPQ